MVDSQCSTGRGLGRFWYMTVSIQRCGHFRYMMTSVHMRSILVHVFFCSTTSVHAKYRCGTSLSRYRYIASCLFMSANAEWMFGLLC